MTSATSPPPRGALRIATAPGGAGPLRCPLPAPCGGAGAPPWASSRGRGVLPPRCARLLGLRLALCVFPPSLDLSQCTAGGLCGVKATPFGWGCAPAWTPAPPQWRRCERREQRQNCRGPVAQRPSNPVARVLPPHQREEAQGNLDAPSHHIPGRESKRRPRLFA